MDSKGRRKCSQANTILFTAKKLLRYTSVGIIIAWKGAHLSQRLNIYCRIPSHDVGGSAGANAMPARDALLLAMHCIGFQNGRRHADENVWDHELATSDPLKTLEPPLYVGSKQTRTKFSHKWRSNEWKQEFAQVYRTVDYKYRYTVYL